MHQIGNLYNCRLHCQIQSQLYVHKTTSAGSDKHRHCIAILSQEGSISVLGKLGFHSTLSLKVGRHLKW